MAVGCSISTVGEGHDIVIEFRRMTYTLFLSLMADDFWYILGHALERVSR